MKASDYNCQCGKKAVQFFPKYSVEEGKDISKPYCKECLAKMRKEVAEDIMRNGRLN
jgi:hypothetical protein